MTACKQRSHTLRQAQGPLAEGYGTANDIVTVRLILNQSKRKRFNGSLAKCSFW